MNHDMNPLSNVKAVCFDWGGTLMSETGPEDLPMCEWSSVSAISGAPECLASLADTVPLCIATNATVSRRAMIASALARVGLDRYFSYVFCYTEIGFKKGQPGFWHAVEQTLQIPASRIAMVGDSLEQDCRAPRSFGVQAVWFNEDGRALSPKDDVPMVTRLSVFADWVRNAI